MTVVVLAEARHRRDRHVGVGEGGDDAVLAPHVVGRAEPLAQRRAAQRPRAARGVAHRVGQVRAPARDPLEAERRLGATATLSANQPSTPLWSMPSGAALIGAQHMGGALESPLSWQGELASAWGRSRSPWPRCSRLAGPAASQDPEPEGPSVLVARDQRPRRADQDDPDRRRPRRGAARGDVDGARAASRPDRGRPPARQRRGPDHGRLHLPPPALRGPAVQVQPPPARPPHPRRRRPGDRRRERRRDRRPRRQQLPQPDGRPRAPLHARAARRDRHRRRRQPALQPRLLPRQLRRRGVVGQPGRRRRRRRRRAAAQRHDPPGQGAHQRRARRAAPPTSRPRPSRPPPASTRGCRSTSPSRSSTRRSSRACATASSSRSRSR